MSASREKRSRKGTQEEILTQQASVAAEQKTKKKKNLLIGIAVTLAVVLFIGSIVLLNGPFFLRTSVAVKTGSHEISPVEVRYHYLDTYQQIINNGYSDILIRTYGEGTDIQHQPMNEEGKTWSEDVMERALERISTTYAFYDQLNAEGYVLSADGEEVVKNAMTTIDLYASFQNLTTDDYLRSIYGRGSSRESYEAYQYMLASVNEYQVTVSESFEFTEADLNAAYEAAPEDYQFYTYRSYLVAADNKDEKGNKLEGKALELAMSDAKAKADAMVEASIGNEEGYLQYCAEYSGNEDHLKGKLSMRTNVNTDNMSLDIRDWVTDPARQEGDVTAIEYEGTGYYVVYWISSNNSDYDAWDVRLIALSAYVTGEDNTSVLDWDSAKEKADALLAEVEASEDLLTDMDTLAYNYSAFEDTATTGGLYEAVYQGKFEEAVNDWIFAEGRQAGDYELIQGADGYYFVYMENNIGNYRDFLVDLDLKLKAYDSWYNEVVANATVEETSGMNRTITTLYVPTSSTSYSY